MIIDLPAAVVQAVIELRAAKIAAREAIAAPLTPGERRPDERCTACNAERNTMRGGDWCDDGNYHRWPSDPPQWDQQRKEIKRRDEATANLAAVIEEWSK